MFVQDDHTSVLRTAYQLQNHVKLVMILNTGLLAKINGLQRHFYKILYFRNLFHIIICNVHGDSFHNGFPTDKEGNGRYSCGSLSNGKLQEDGKVPVSRRRGLG